MAIQVGGTTVIDNTPNLVNVGGLKTINGTSILGSGNISAGASTTFGDVGTYIFGGASTMSSGYYSAGTTYAGSSLRPGGLNSNNAQTTGTGSTAMYHTSSANIFVIGGHYGTMSGTWRSMGDTYQSTFQSYGPTTLFVRIS